MSYYIIMSKNIFGKRLKELRKENKLTQQELVIKLNCEITQASIARWENNLRVPNLDAVITLAKFFNVSLDFIAGLVDFKYLIYIKKREVVPFF